MSHFTVMVQIPKGRVGKAWNFDVEGYVTDVLAQYDETLEVDPYVSETAAQVVKAWDYAKAEFPEDGYDKLSVEEFAERWYGRELDAEGNLLTTYNPKSKWDWWVIGGRWSNMLRLMDGSHADYAFVKDIDFEGILEDDRKRKEAGWEEAYQKGAGDNFNKFMYGITTATKEKHVATATGLTTFAVVTKDGEWCEKGKMGWWGMSSDTEEESKAWDEAFYKNFIEPLDPEDIIVIVDCHI